MFSFEEMEEMYELLIMEDENGNEEPFFVIDSLDIDNTGYFLVISANIEANYDEEVTSYIMKGLLNSDDDGCILEMLEDGDEYDIVMKLFNEEQEQDDTD